MGVSRIEWTDETTNPLVGCSHASPGCDHCYAEIMAARLAAMAEADVRAGRNPGRKTRYGAVVTGGRWNGQLAALPPSEWGREPWARPDAAPRRIFVGSMTDVFHPAAPPGFLGEYLAFVGQFPQHLFLFLTKRPERAAAAGLHWPDNCALGATVETAAQLGRLGALRRSGCGKLFGSFEPLLGPVEPAADDLAALSWCIVGGESGPKARPMHRRWPADLRDRCVAAGVPFFLKSWGEYRYDPRMFETHVQWVNKAAGWIGGTNARCMGMNGHECRMGADFDRPGVFPVGIAYRVGKVAAGRELDGRVWDELPDWARLESAGSLP